MPELPEVETLVRGLQWLIGQKIDTARVHRERVIRPTSRAALRKALIGATFDGVTRRGKYILFHMKAKEPACDFILLGHLGMTGRMYRLTAKASLPKHAAIVLKLSKDRFVFEDTRYFGRFTLELAPLAELGPEPLSEDFTIENFGELLSGSAQPIKVKLLDQKMVAGLGNIYASEALFRAFISPSLPARKLTKQQVAALHAAIRQVLDQAIKSATRFQLDFGGKANQNRLFYFGTEAGSNSDSEQLQVYDREGKPCVRCHTKIQRIVQAGRSTFFCPHCQARDRHTRKREWLQRQDSNL